MSLPAPPPAPTHTTIRRYKGERQLAQGIAKMQAQGWRVQDRTSRKLWWSWLTGIFTRKQSHTVTFVR